MLDVHNRPFYLMCLDRVRYFVKIRSSTNIFGICRKSQSPSRSIRWIGIACTESLSNKCRCRINAAYSCMCRVTIGSSLCVWLRMEARVGCHVSSGYNDWMREVMRVELR